MLRTLAMGATLALAAAPALAAPFALDKAHTQVTFTVDHLGYSRTHGTFRDFDGAVDLNREKPEQSKVSFTVRTASIDTQWPQRDDHLRSKDFLNAAQFPTMTFESTRIERTGEGGAKVHGNLTLLGVTKPITLNVTLNKLAESPLNNKLTAGFTAETVVKRSEWGMKTYVPAVGDEVKVVIAVEATPSS